MTRSGLMLRASSSRKCNREGKCLHILSSKRMLIGVWSRRQFLKISCTLVASKLCSGLSIIFLLLRRQNLCCSPIHWPVLLYEFRSFFLHNLTYSSHMFSLPSQTIRTRKKGAGCLHIKKHWTKKYNASPCFHLMLGLHRVDVYLSIKSNQVRTIGVSVGANLIWRRDLLKC
jgi:hypothetical protein